MIWLQAAALAGLVAVAVPILAHLVARRATRRLVFPTLRFIEAPPPSARARHLLSDWPLLVTRMAIVALASIALAQPLLVSQRRVDAALAREARVTLVDTSASMLRPARSGPGRVLDAARARAAADAHGAFRSLTIETADMREGLRRAERWLSTAPPARQVIAILTDAQRGTLPAQIPDTVPPHVGVTIEAFDARGTTSALAPRMSRVDGRVIVEARSLSIVDGDGVGVITASPSAGAPCVLQVQVSVADDDPALAGALRDAAIAEGVPCAPEGSPSLTVAVSQAAAAAASPAAPFDATMLGLVTRMHALLSPSDAALVAWSRQGDALIAHATVSPLDDAAARIVAAAFAAYEAPDISREADPRRELPVTLAAWDRAASAPPDESFRYEPSSDGRWGWVAVLALLAFEWWLRRHDRLRGSEAPGVTRAA